MVMVLGILSLLGISKCKRIIFISSVGALDTEIGIGDIVIPEYSVSGDGASRYIASRCRCFWRKSFPIHLYSNFSKKKRKESAMRIMSNGILARLSALTRFLLNFLILITL